MMTKEMVVLKKKYLEEIVPEMQKRFNYTNKMRIPKLEKICINRSMSASKSTNKTLDSMVKELTIISGQKPLVTKSKKSISNFKLRENLENKNFNNIIKYRAKINTSHFYSENQCFLRH